MTTIYITWQDGINSSESFKNNGEFYKYMNFQKEEGNLPVKLETENSNWIGEGFDGPNKSRIEMKIIW